MEPEQFDKLLKQLFNEMPKDKALRAAYLMLRDLNTRVLTQQAQIHILQSQINSLDSRTIGSHLIG